MSASLSVKAFSGKNSEMFQKHLKAVKFCLENELSFPKETSEFFKGKLGGDDLESINRKYILGYIENGVEVPLKFLEEGHYYIKFKVSDIPAGVDEIEIKMV